MEITKSPTDQKAHAKSPESVMTLERALKREERFNAWSIQTVDALNTCAMWPAEGGGHVDENLGAGDQAGEWVVAKEEDLFVWLFL